jgi:hypothetical protein
MEIISFAVDEEPHACWDFDLSQKNMEFLNGIDVGYFEYVAEAHAEALEGDNRHRAALALRITYSQALEVLFALLSSMVQAPNCVVGWMLSYNNRQLRNVVRKIDSHQPVLTRFIEKDISWDLLAKYVHSYLGYDQAKMDWIRDGFGKLWRRFASDFLDEKFIDEYNGAKHGLRVRPGGFTLAIGIQEVPGTPASDDKMQNLGGSKFGTSYFVRERILDNNKMNFRPRRHSRNWDPYNFINGLMLLSMSINNVIASLRILNKVDPKECKFWTPNEDGFFDAPWQRSVGVINFDFDRIIRPENVRPVTREQALATYHESNENNGKQWGQTYTFDKIARTLENKTKM